MKLYAKLKNNPTNYPVEVVSLNYTFELKSVFVSFCSHSHTMLYFVADFLNINFLPIFFNFSALFSSIYIIYRNTLISQEIASTRDCFTLFL